MSRSIFIMGKMLAQMAKSFEGADIEIIETHHNRKIDSPSGTAIYLADCINKAKDNSYTYNFNRHMTNKKREKNEIGFSSIRGGNISGEHDVRFYFNDEMIELKHESYSRSIFAKGALDAANYIYEEHKSRQSWFL